MFLGKHETLSKPDNVHIKWWKGIILDDKFMNRVEGYADTYREKSVWKTIEELYILAEEVLAE